MKAYKYTYDMHDKVKVEEIDFNFLDAINCENYFGVFVVNGEIISTEEFFSKYLNNKELFETPKTDYIYNRAAKEKHEFFKATKYPRELIQLLLNQQLALKIKVFTEIESECEYNDETGHTEWSKISYFKGLTNDKIITYFYDVKPLEKEPREIENITSVVQRCTCNLGNI